MTIKDPEFRIGQTVYHKVAGEIQQEAVVTDIQYSVAAGIYQYIVSAGFGHEAPCSATELTEDKIY